MKSLYKLDSIDTPASSLKLLPKLFEFEGLCKYDTSPDFLTLMERNHLKPNQAQKHRAQINMI